MEIERAHAALDEQLPDGLRGSVEFLGANRSDANDSSQSEETAMNGQTVTPGLTIETVRAAANEEAGKLMAATNSQVQVAASIEKHLLVANEAKLALSRAEATIADLNKQIEASKAEAKKAMDEVKTAKDADEKAKKEKGDQDAIYKKAKADLEQVQKDLTEANKKLADFDAQKTVANREQAIATANVKSASFKTRATARAEDGKFKMSDDDFTAAIAEFKEQVGEQAAAGDGGGAPVPAPKDKPGPASKQPNKTDGKPVPAPKDNAGPADKQKGGKGAHASTEGDTAAQGDVEGGEQAAAEGEAGTTQATASTVPAAPDLSDAQIYAQAAAAVLSHGPTVTKDGKSRYASAFGIERS